MTGNVDRDRLRRALLSPENVAIIGASDNPARLTSRPQRFMEQHGFTGRIWPVNPGRDMVLGVPACAGMSDIPVPVDHAYILLNTEPAMAAFQDCIDAGVPVVSMLADGFAEAGPEGLARQEKLRTMAADAGILLIGPNSTGMIRIANGFACTTNAAFAQENLRPGRVAVLSQSGSLTGTLLSRAEARQQGFSTLISTGNEAGAGIGQLGNLLLDDPETDAFALFLETIRDADEIASFARAAAERGKPVLAYVIGRSTEGQALSTSHTGALTGSADAMSAWLKSIGIQEVTTLDTLIDAPSALASVAVSPARPETVTVLSTTGGGGAMVLDQIAARGVDIAGISDAARKALSADDIPLGHGKLVDVTLAGTQYETMKQVVSTLISDPETGLLVVTIGSSARFNPELAVQPIVDAQAEAGSDAAPIVAIPLPDAPESLRLLQAGGVPAFASVEACAETVQLLFNRQSPADPLSAGLPDDVVGKLAKFDGAASETEAGSVFQALGISRPAEIVLSPDQTLPDVLPFRFPVVAKLVSPDLPHKTEAGAVRVGIPDRTALVDAIQAMQASARAYRPDCRIDGVLIQEMCQGVGEALLGLTRDPLVGPVLTLAAGGVMTEIYQDAVVHPAPLTPETARKMIDGVKAFQLLKGFRGRSPGDLDALADAIHRFSLLAIDGRVREAEINPLLVREQGQGVVMLDALLVMSDGAGNRAR